jgi:hypothetical protein
MFNTPINEANIYFVSGVVSPRTKKSILKGKSELFPIILLYIFIDLFAMRIACIRTGTIN